MGEIDEVREELRDEVSEVVGDDVVEDVGEDVNEVAGDDVIEDPGEMLEVLPILTKFNFKSIIK